MRLPVESSSSWAHIVWASFTWASLNAWSEFTDLSESVRNVLRGLADAARAAMDNLLREARETQELTVFARPGAQAKQDAWLILSRRRLADTLNTVAAKVGGGSKDHPAVREFLPDLLAGITDAPIAARSRLLREAAGRLAALSVDFPEKAVLAGKLHETAAGLQAAIAQNDAALASWTGERSEDTVAKRRLRLELERVHGSLKAQFPGQSAFVESFFYKQMRRRADGAAQVSIPATSTEIPAPQTPAPAAPTTITPQ